MSGFVVGKVTKRSRFGMDQARRTVESARWCARFGMGFHLIDAEWRENYPGPRELAAILSHTESLDPSLRTIVTVSARHTDSMRRIAEYVEASKGHNMGLNIVAGNKAYLSLQERGRSPAKALSMTVRHVRGLWPGGMVLIGAEGLLETAMRLAARFDLIPFLLMDKGLEDSVGRIRDEVGGCPIAVYAPFLISESEDVSLIVLRSLYGYVLRRGWVRDAVMDLGYEPEGLGRRIGEMSVEQIRGMRPRLRGLLLEAVSRLSIAGDQGHVVAGLRRLKRLNVGMAAMLPIAERVDQIRMMGECASRLRDPA
ncbi:TPA: hypothetical protein EYP44_01030 [Candidatus Bathyarchaeota archaeon]|nr:hypothetical protein [Candidatus Bathyarchaeota archaeon]